MVNVSLAETLARDIVSRLLMYRQGNVFLD